MDVIRYRIDGLLTVLISSNGKLGELRTDYCERIRDDDNSPRQTELDEGNELTHGIGVLLNKLQEWLNFTIFRSKPKNTDYEHRMAMSFSSLKENAGFIGRSLSYGLILFCLGLCVVLIYLLVSSLL